jgi:adenylate kinase
MILLMGIAGSGKGTQGKMLADQHGFHLISMGDVLRMYVTGEQRRRMLAGGLLDDQEIIKIVDKVLTSLPDKEQLILDGFPRTIPQAKWLLEQAEAGRFNVEKVFHLVATRDAVKKRLMSRGRIDDHEDAIEARFNEYERSTAPLLEWFNDHGLAVDNIDAERPVEKVNQDLIDRLKR